MTIEPCGHPVICGPPEARLSLPGLIPIQDSCTVCGEAVIYSESTAEHVRSGQLVPVCGPCGMTSAMLTGASFAATKQTLETMDEQGLGDRFQAHVEAMNRVFQKP